MLRKNIKEYEEKNHRSQNEINNLNSRINGFNSEQTFSTASGATSSKIVELSKKIREKTAEVEVLKTKCAKLEKNVLQLTENPVNNLGTYDTITLHKVMKVISFFQHQLNNQDL